MINYCRGFNIIRADNKHFTLYRSYIVSRTQKQLVVVQIRHEFNAKLKSVIQVCENS